MPNSNVFIVAEKNHRLYTPQINHISLRMPPSPPLSQYNDLPSGILCNESSVVNCQHEFCDCTYTLQIPLGSLVELVLIDKGNINLSNVTRIFFKKKLSPTCM
jgi:hypothetical protein